MKLSAVSTVAIHIDGDSAGDRRSDDALLVSPRLVLLRPEVGRLADRWSASPGTSRPVVRIQHERAGGVVVETYPVAGTRTPVERTDPAITVAYLDEPALAPYVDLGLTRSSTATDVRVALTSALADVEHTFIKGLDDEDVDFSICAFIPLPWCETVPPD